MGLVWKRSGVARAPDPLKRGLMGESLVSPVHQAREEGERGSSAMPACRARCSRTKDK